MIKRPYASVFACPVCGKQSVYVDDLDRVMHADGSNNRWCWASPLRNEPKYYAALPEWLRHPEYTQS